MNENPDVNTEESVLEKSMTFFENLKTDEVLDLIKNHKTEEILALNDQKILKIRKAIPCLLNAKREQIEAFLGNFETVDYLLRESGGVLMRSVHGAALGGHKDYANDLIGRSNKLIPSKCIEAVAMGAIQREIQLRKKDHVILKNNADSHLLFLSSFSSKYIPELVKVFNNQWLRGIKKRTKKTAILMSKYSQWKKEKTHKRFELEKDDIELMSWGAVVCQRISQVTEERKLLHFLSSFSSECIPDLVMSLNLFQSTSRTEEIIASAVKMSNDIQSQVFSHRPALFAPFSPPINVKQGSESNMNPSAESWQCIIS